MNNKDNKRANPLIDRFRKRNGIMVGNYTPDHYYAIYSSQKIKPQVTFKITIEDVTSPRGDYKSKIDKILSK